MPKSIDIRKVVLPDGEYYQSVEDSFGVTFINHKEILYNGYSTDLQYH